MGAERCGTHVAAQHKACTPSPPRWPHCTATGTARRAVCPHPHPRALRTRGTFGCIPITECCQLLPRRAAAPLQRRCLLCSPLSPY